MYLKKVVAIQYKELVNHVKASFRDEKLPQEGWICTVRKALGMSRVQLGNRLGVTRAQVFKYEKEELKGNITLKTMHRVAEAMGCSMVYVVVPPKKVDDLITEQALRKAKNIVAKANVQMALEEQLLSEDKIKFEINRIAQELLNKMPSDLWE